MMEGGGVLGRTPIKEALDTLLEVRADTSAEILSNTLPTKENARQVIMKHQIHSLYRKEEDTQVY